MARDNKKLREILFALSTDEEKDSYLKEEKLEEVSNATKDIKEKLENDTSNEAIIAALKDLSAQVSRIKLPPTDQTPVVEAIKAMTKELSLSSKPQDLSGFFKDLGIQLAQTGSSSKNTEELIKNLKWNSSMALRNSSGSPISPAISSFQLSDWNDVLLSGYDANGNPSTVTYKLGAQTVAILALTYDGSGNLTEARRTS